jgi:GAF domain-containing protein
MDEQYKRKKRNFIIDYSLAGFGFGLLFPIAATLIELLTNRIPITPNNIWQSHSNNPLLWIIDTAPFFLGLFAYLIGVQQDTLVHSNEELQNRGSELKTAYSSIEQRIQEQTHDIFLNSKKLKAVAQVAREASSIHDLEKLLDKVTLLTAKQFDFYHVGIFLLDDSGKTAILQAANSDGGKRMLERGHRLQVGTVGIVGYVAGTGKTRVALDVGEDAVYFQNPDLPETRSEMALPLTVRGKVIGVLDIQSSQPHAFVQEDIDILQILADQVAIAIDNARLLLQSQAVIQQLQAISAEQARQIWMGSLREQSHGFLYTPLGFKSLQDDDQLQEKSQPEAGHQLSVPILLRGQEIGRIKLQRALSQPMWSKKEQALAADITNQVALALENARLITEVQQRAERERTISQITSRMRETLDIDTVLQTAVQEMRKSLNLKQAEVRLQNAPFSEPQKQVSKKGAGK